MPGRVLAGLRILDLTRVVAGPVRDRRARRSRRRRDQAGAPRDRRRLSLWPVAEGPDLALLPEHQPRQALGHPRPAQARGPRALPAPRASGPTPWSRTSARAGSPRRGWAPARSRRAIPAAWSRRSRASGRPGRGRGRPPTTSWRRRPAACSRSRAFRTGRRCAAAARSAISSAASTSASASPRRCSSASARAGARVLDLSNQDAIFAITDSAATIFCGDRRRA